MPSEADGGARWSVDHLFLDQDAVPTLVEVKRSSDTRIRREVVGQMLDYAANAVVYWPVDRLRATFEAGCGAQGRGPDDVLAESLGEELDIEGFWENAQTNLQAGRVRLVFVDDAIPAEVRRIIEFLNVQMSPAEVIGIKVRQYVGESLKTLSRASSARQPRRSSVRAKHPVGASNGPGVGRALDELDAPPTVFR